MLRFRCSICCLLLCTQGSLQVWFDRIPSQLTVLSLASYLYYSASGPGPDAGLFRCSFDNMTATERVAAGADLNFATFVIDHTNFSVLVPGREKNTVFALSMIRCVMNCLH